jgi:putative membrane protein
MHMLIPFAHANGWDGGHWWIVFPIFWLLVLVFFVTVVWRRGPRGGDPAKRILGERFARGEISADEYRERLAQLR